jgi:hypothetical protein
MQHRNRNAMLSLSMGLPSGAIIIETQEAPHMDVGLDNRPARRSKRTNKKMKQRGF